MTIDVVIPLYNGRKWIEETLHSVFSQTLKPSKVIVVDDGSTDGSYELVSKISGIILLRTQNKVEEGPAAARNLGFDQTTAPFVAFPDQDDIWHPDHLRMLHDILAKNPYAPFAISSFLPFEDGAQHHFDLANKLIEVIDPWRLYPIQRFVTSPSFILYRSENVGKVRWTIGHSGASDYSLYMKLAISKLIIRCAAKTVAYRQHRSSHYSQLITSPLKFLSLWLKITDNLLEHRLKCLTSKEEKIFFTRRNTIAHMLYDLVQSVMDNDEKLFKKSALLLEEKLLGESKDLCESTVYQLMDYLSFDYFKEKQFKKYYSCYEMLLDLWPKHAYVTRKVLVEFILEKRPGANFYKRLILSKPYETWRILLAFEALNKRCMKTFAVPAGI